MTRPCQNFLKPSPFEADMGALNVRDPRTMPPEEWYVWPVTAILKRRP